ncbi:MAG: hypothetical protein KDC67_08470 [Ignavibacteriae bacterium]|nr:hypothetical protein [Ignavibacteriota bacterium]MCB0746762.1 hypothetical protein [Ignavibacteriota bacterium]
MEAYFDASLTASILLQEVMKELKIKLSPGKCCREGLDKKIFRKCKRIIEKEYTDKNYQELLKLYISSYFIDESIQENGTEFEDLSDLEYQSNYDDFEDSIQLAK